MAETTTITELKKFILTQAQYDALLAADEIEPNAEYYITDADTEAVASGYPYTLEFGVNRENTQQVVLDIKGMEGGVPEGVQMFLMRNLPKKKHVTNLGDSKEYHYTSGWRHPRHNNENDRVVHPTEWNIDDPNTWAKDTSECLASFVYFGQHQTDKNNLAYARVNGRQLAMRMDKLNTHYMETFFSPRPIAAFGFALFEDGVRVSNICPVKITVYGDMLIHNGAADELRIYAYPA